MLERIKCDEKKYRKRYTKKELSERLLMIELRLSTIRTMIENRREGFKIKAQISSTLHTLESVAKDIRCKFVDDCSDIEKLVWKMDDELVRILV